MANKCDGCQYKGEHQEMGFRPFGVCNLELNLWEAEVAYNAEECPHKDRLLKVVKKTEKTYTLEELAKMICESYEECAEGVCPGWDYCDLRKSNGILEWLKTILKSEPNT